MDPNSTSAFDPEFDGHFLSDFAPKFYSLAGNDKLSVNTLPDWGNNVSIPFVFEKNNAGNFVIELETAQVIPDITIYLTDNKTGSKTNLTQNPVYAFSAADGDDVNRFVLTFLSSTGLAPETVNNGVDVYISDNLLHISQSTLQSGKISLFSLTGQLINSYELEASLSQSISLPTLAPGIYLVSVATSHGNYTKKVIIR
jgi:hypothetical protein